MNNNDLSDLNRVKTAEEILIEFGCPDVTFDENVTMYYPAILSAMEEYANARVGEAMRYQSSPKIKQLEWVEYENFLGRKSYFAKTPFTPFEVADTGGHYIMFSPDKRLKFVSADKAKAAAQADFERRVRECLDLKAQQKQALIDMMRGDEEIGLYDDNPKNHGYER